LTRQRLLRDNGRVSMMSTRSPSPHSLRSSCARYRLRWRIRFPYSGCSTNRSTCTTTVLIILAATTVPSRRLTRSRIGSLLCRRGFLPEHGQDSRQLAARLSQRRRVVELAGLKLQSEPEDFLARLAFLDLQVGRAHLPEFIKLQGQP